ncbi:PaaI family thioesterase [Pelosinus propionicus]|uniref:Acyl-CoA thioesterase n=1 Tax=Pelosinus propionicus DSM 13327 TaxID=1123291 RepID=A0A1I4LKU3_9FIRM|nr:PaaI family thioesterase [Pelosinus propionicus]SFL91605.1 acyl-CoA thioesterase [Pelosinus propionicus DSM 13327]
MENITEWLKENLVTIYNENPYIKLLDISIGHVEEGKVELHMPVLAGKHTNLYNIAHGGALASLGDSAMGIACATTGKKVVTLEMNMNFIKGAVAQSAIKAIGKVIHNGKTTMVAESEIIDSQNQILAKTRGTFFVIGMFEDNQD